MEKMFPAATPAGYDPRGTPQRPNGKLMARNLIVLRCGAESLHGQWLEGAERNWDIVLCPYQDIDAKGIESHLIVGQKWSGLYRFLLEYSRWRDYDYICLPDDDIETTAGTWNTFFDRCAALKAELAAPALTPDSFFSHAITLQNPNFLARATSFVEVMNPCFSRSFLEIALPTFALSRSGAGWGLDFLWGAMLSHENLWIIDETAVRHARPVGISRDKVLSSLAEYDIARIRGFDVPWKMYHTGGITTEGNRLLATDLEFDKRLRRGYQYLEARIPERWPDNLFERSRLPEATDPEVMKRIKLSLAHLAAPDRTLSRGRPCSVSTVAAWSWSDDPNLAATGANDGLLNGHCGFHTDNEMNPWWQVDLGAPCSVTSIVIYNRLDQKERCIDLDIQSSFDNRAWTTVFAKRDGHPFGGLDGSPLTVQFVPNFRGRYVRVQLPGEGFLHLDQVEIFGTPGEA